MRTMRSRPPASSVSESKPPAFAVASIRCSSPHPRRADRRPPGRCSGCAASAVSEPSARYTVSPAAERTATLAGTPSNGITVPVRSGSFWPASLQAGNTAARSPAAAAGSPSRPGDRTAPARRPRPRPRRRRGRRRPATPRRAPGRSRQRSSHAPSTPTTRSGASRHGSPTFPPWSALVASRRARSRPCWP